jgi:hypothetical protein
MGVRSVFEKDLLCSGVLDNFSAMLYAFMKIYLLLTIFGKIKLC